MSDATPQDALARLHERLDDVFVKMVTIQETVAVIAANCPVCRDDVSHLKQTLHGNGGSGVLTRLTAAEVGRVDTLSVKSVVTLVGSIGALAAAIGAAMASVVR